jgi:hypothetical protein
MDEYTTFDNLNFWVIMDKNTNKYLKKTARGNHVTGFWTGRIGQARIFSSKAQANIGYNKDDETADYIVVGYYATRLHTSEI